MRRIAWGCTIAVLLLAGANQAGNRATAQFGPPAPATAPAAARATSSTQTATSEKANSAGASAPSADDTIRCANLVYAVSKSSVCFSDRFLQNVRTETNCQPDAHFKTVKLGTDDLFNYPFSIMTGEGAFSLQEQEGKNLRAYLTRGGFLLASAGCSSRDWDKSFRAAIAKYFPEYKLEKIAMDHPIFHTVYDIGEISLTHGGKGQMEGLTIDGKIVMIYSPDGLNDTGNVNGCCCCGGNEVRDCRQFNVNVFAYAMTH